jgi:hypothetical protein
MLSYGVTQARLLWFPERVLEACSGQPWSPFGYLTNCVHSWGLVDHRFPVDEGLVGGGAGSRGASFSPQKIASSRGIVVQKNRRLPFSP